MKRTVDEWGELHNLRLGNDVDWKKKVTFQEFSDMIESYGFEHRVSLDDLITTRLKMLIDSKELDS